MFRRVKQVACLVFALLIVLPVTARAQLNIDLIGGGAKKQVEAAARAAQQKQIAEAKARIQAKVLPKIVLPADLKGRPEGIYEVTLLPGGDVLEVELKRSSGVPAYDAAVGRAITNASPLPVPEDPDLFQQHFRKFNFTFKPES